MSSTPTDAGTAVTLDGVEVPELVRQRISVGSVDILRAGAPLKIGDSLCLAISIDIVEEGKAQNADGVYFKAKAAEPRAVEISAVDYAQHAQVGLTIED